MSEFDRSERARRALEERQARQSRPPQPTRNAPAYQLEYNEARHARLQQFLNQTDRTLRRLDTEDFPGVKFVTVGYKKRLFADVAITEPGWLVYQDMATSEMTIYGTKYYLLANGNYLYDYMYSSGWHNRKSESSILNPQQLFNAMNDTQLNQIGDGLEALPREPYQLPANYEPKNI